jgi:hypothetical protein
MSAQGAVGLISGTRVRRGQDRRIFAGIALKFRRGVQWSVIGRKIEVARKNHET